MEYRSWGNTGTVCRRCAWDDDFGPRVTTSSPLNSRPSWNGGKLIDTADVYPTGVGAIIGWLGSRTGPGTVVVATRALPGEGPTTSVVPGQPPGLERPRPSAWNDRLSSAIL